MKRFSESLHAIDFHVFRILSRLGRIWLALLGVLTLLALALGYLGYSRLEEGPHAVHSRANDAYRTLQLFVLETPSLAGDLPWTLNLARWMAAIISFSAVVSLLGKVFFGRIQALRLFVLGHHHVILCGLGEKGSRLVEALRKQLLFVVVIEPDPNHEDSAQCLSLGAILLTGSSTDAWQLQRARIRQADVLLALFHRDDRLNVETAVLAYELCKAPRPHTLTCVLQVADLDMPSVVRKHVMATSETDWFDLELVNMHDACSRAMLREAVLSLGGLDPKHLLVVGLDPDDRLGEMIILRASKDRHIHQSDDPSKLTIDVVDVDATGKIMRLRQKYPYLDQVANLRPMDLDPTQMGFRQEFAPSPGEPAPDVALVCLKDEEKAIVVADQLRGFLPAQVPIVVRTIERDSGLGALLKGRVHERMIAVGLKDRVLQLATSLHPEQELLAQAVHQEYFQHQRRRGLAPGPDRPAIHFWEDVEETYRASSRAQVRDFDRKLQLVGCRKVFIPDRLVNLHRFNEEEVETLAQDEHDRWCEEKTRNGWTYGPVRDDRRKIHPNLIPWNVVGLSEEIKDIDRNAVRRLPRVLAMSDYEIVRVAMPE